MCLVLFMAVITKHFKQEIKTLPHLRECMLGVMNFPFPHIQRRFVTKLFAT